MKIIISISLLLLFSTNLPAAFDARVAKLSMEWDDNQTMINTNDNCNEVVCYYEKSSDNYQCENLGTLNSSKHCHVEKNGVSYALKEFECSLRKTLHFLVASSLHFLFFF